MQAKQRYWDRAATSHPPCLHFFGISTREREFNFLIADVSKGCKKTMDSELLKKFKAGDHATFNRIMEQYQKPIYYFIYRMTGNAKDAEDLTQDTFVKAYLERERFRGDSAINTWIYRIAANLTKNHLRWHSLRRYAPLDAVLQFFFPESEESHYETMEALEEHLLDYVQQLPSRQRSVFVLKYYNGLTHEEISNILKISLGASKTNFHYAVKTLKEIVRKHNG